MQVILLLIAAVFIWLRWRGPLSKRWPLPESRRQIPSEVFLNGPQRGAARFGFELGTGVRTYVTSPAPYLVLAVVVFCHLSALHAFLIGTGFGLARAAPLLVQVSNTQREELTASFLSGHKDFAPHTAGILVMIGGALLV
jgi:hypothetical protein